MKTVVVTGLIGLLLASLNLTPPEADASADPVRVALTESLAQRLGASPAEANVILENQARSHTLASSLEIKYGLRPENFSIADDGTLIVSVPSSAEFSRIIPEEGMKVVVAAMSPTEVDNVMGQVAQSLASNDTEGVLAVSADYGQGGVLVEVDGKAGTDSGVQAVDAFKGVTVQTAPAGTEPKPAFNAVPGPLWTSSRAATAAWGLEPCWAR